MAQEPILTDDDFEIQFRSNLDKYKTIIIQTSNNEYAKKLQQNILTALNKYTIFQIQYDNATRTISALNDDKTALLEEVKSLERSYMELTSIKIAMGKEILVLREQVSVLAKDNHEYRIALAKVEDRN